MNAMNSQNREARDIRKENKNYQRHFSEAHVASLKTKVLSEGRGVSQISVGNILTAESIYVVKLGRGIFIFLPIQPFFLSQENKRRPNHETYFLLFSGTSI